VVTHARNIDPDAFISRLLLESYFDPTRKPFVWDTPEHLQLLIDAARFGDTTFFGGVDLNITSAHSLPAAQQLGLAILELINEGREQFVFEHLREAAVLNRNLLSAAAKVEPDLAHSGRLMLALRSVYRMINAQCASEEAPHSTAHAQQFLSRLLGSDCLTWPTLKQRVIESLQTAEGDQKLDLVQRTLRKAVLESLFPSQIRELFQGKVGANIYGPAHRPLWNESVIENLSATISGTILGLLSDEDKACFLADHFIRAMRRVSSVAEKRTTTLSIPDVPEKRVSITTASQPLNPDAGVPRNRRVHLVDDWLREAAAALSVVDPQRPYLPPAWLHIMDRGDGNIVVSSRFARPNEPRPVIDLSNPSVVAELNAMEAAAAQGANQSATRIIIKGNLWLPDGGPLHVPREAIVALLLRRYDEIVQVPSASSSPQRLYPTVEIIAGKLLPFNVISAALLAQLNSDESEKGSSLGPQ
jgi:hypothetical protein